MLSEAQRKQRATIGAYELHAQGKTTTVAARAASLGRFLDAQPTDIPEAERERRAASARKPFYARMAFASSKARSRAGKKIAAAPTPAAIEEVRSASSATSATS